MLKPLVLRRRDDHSVRITLVRYQDPATLPYFFGYLKGWHLPAVFVRSVWEVAPEVKQ